MSDISDATAAEKAAAKVAADLAADDKTISTDKAALAHDASVIAADNTEIATLKADTDDTTTPTPTPTPVTTPTPTPPASKANWSTYCYYEGSAGVAALAAAIGHTFDYVMDFGDGSSYTLIADSAPQIIGSWKGKGYKLMYGLPMVANGGSFADVANNDPAWTATAEALVANGFGDAIVRIGWEFNGGWFPWAANGKTAEFVAAYQHIVDVMRTTAGQQFRFCWNPTRGDQGVGDLATYYPGDTYVDLVGDDVYDWFWQHYPGAEAAWQSMLTETYGLNWFIDFAKAHGKQLAFPEWGINGQQAPPTAGAAFTGSGEVCGGDNGYFVTQMLDLIAANNAFSGLWSNGNCALTPSGTPNAIAALKAFTGWA